MSEIARYVMNPKMDVILFGDELKEGMWVMPSELRGDHGTEDERLRAQRFMQVTRLRFMPGQCGTLTCFVGEWVDGYQEVKRFNVSFGWIVRKDSVPGAQGHASERERISGDAQE